MTTSRQSPEYIFSLAETRGKLSSR